MPLDTERVALRNELAELKRLLNKGATPSMQQPPQRTPQPNSIRPTVPRLPAYPTPRVNPYVYRPRTVPFSNLPRFQPPAAAALVLKSTKYVAKGATHPNRTWTRNDASKTSVDLGSGYNDNNAGGVKTNSISPQTSLTTTIGIASGLKREPTSLVDVKPIVGPTSAMPSTNGIGKVDSAKKRDVKPAMDRPSTGVIPLKTLTSPRPEGQQRVVTKHSIRKVVPKMSSPGSLIRNNASKVSPSPEQPVVFNSKFKKGKMKKKEVSDSKYRFYSAKARENRNKVDEALRIKAEFQSKIVPPAFYQVKLLKRQRRERRRSTRLSWVGKVAARVVFDPKYRLNKSQGNGGSTFSAEPGTIPVNSKFRFFSNTARENQMKFDKARVFQAGLQKRRSGRASKEPILKKTDVNSSPPVQKKKKHCVFFTRFGRCNKMATCSFIHDPERVAVCTRFLRGTCRVDDCPFSHIVAPEKMPVCSFFLRGTCNKNPCPYLHVRVSEDADVCEDFIGSGFCALGAKCLKKHVMDCGQRFEALCKLGRKCERHGKVGKAEKSKSIPVLARRERDSSGKALFAGSSTQSLSSLSERVDVKDDDRLVTVAYVGMDAVPGGEQPTHVKLKEEKEYSALKSARKDYISLNSDPEEPVVVKEPSAFFSKGKGIKPRIIRIVEKE